MCTEFKGNKNSCLGHHGGVRGSGPARSPLMRPNDDIEVLFMGCKHKELAGVTLYKDISGCDDEGICQCEGETVRLDITRDILLGEHYYNLNELYKMGIENDAISGVQIQAGYEITFYQH